MIRSRHIGIVAATTAAGLLALSSVAAGAGPGHPWDHPGWDVKTIGTDADETFDFSADDTKNKVIAKGGNDIVYAGPLRDLVRGGGDDDEIWGGDGPDKLHGGRGVDLIVGGDGRDHVKGGPGGDTIDVFDGGPDRVVCGPGDDTVYADLDLDRWTRNCETVLAGPMP